MECRVLECSCWSGWSRGFRIRAQPRPVNASCGEWMQRSFGKLEAGFSQANRTQETVAYCSGCTAVVWMAGGEMESSSGFSSSSSHAFIQKDCRAKRSSWNQKTHLQVSVCFLNVVYDVPSLVWMDRLHRMQVTFQVQSSDFPGKYISCFVFQLL